MLSRTGSRGTGCLERIRTKTISVRIHAFVFVSLLMILFAYAAPACLATANNDAETDAAANTGGNLASDARLTTPPAGPGVAGDSSAAESDDTPIFRVGDAPSVVDNTSSLLKSGRNSGDPAFSAKCVLLPAGLCQAVKNRRIVILASTQTAALISDGVTTRQFLRRGYVEVDPFARVFLGSRPTWGRMAPLGTVQVFAGMWIAERMASSRHVWVRRFWWLPQIMGIAGNVAASAHNVRLR